MFLPIPPLPSRPAGERDCSCKQDRLYCPSQTTHSVVFSAVVRGSQAGRLLAACSPQYSRKTALETVRCCTLKKKNGRLGKGWRPFFRPARPSLPELNWIFCPRSKPGTCPTADRSLADRRIPRHDSRRTRRAKPFPASVCHKKEKGAQLYPLRWKGAHWAEFIRPGPGSPAVPSGPAVTLPGQGSSSRLASRAISPSARRA